MIIDMTALDTDVAEAARRAVDQACAFVDREFPEEHPLVMLSDDGVVMLQWRGQEAGVLLIFTGDGTCTYSIKEPGGSYTTNSTEFTLHDNLPSEVRLAIEHAASCNLGVSEP